MEILKYVEGDVFEFVKNIDPDVTVVIPHVCNDIGVWGAGFVIPLGENYPVAKSAYLLWSQGVITKPELVSYYSKYQKFDVSIGTTQIVDLSYLEQHNSKTIICNMIAQEGVGAPRAVRYNYLAECMNWVAIYARIMCKKPQIHAPMFGSGLGGGNWNFIEELIKDAWLRKDIPVTIYSLPEKK